MTTIGANQLVLRLLGSGFSPLVNGKLCALRYPAARTSAPVVFPVQYAPAGVEILVVAGNPDGKRWWRHFRDGSHTDVLLDGRWTPAEGRVLVGAERAAAAGTYRSRFPRVTTAGAWLLGLAVFLGVTMPLWQPGQGLPTTIAIGVLGGFLMAATTSAVTAFAVRRLPGLG